MVAQPHFLLFCDTHVVDCPVGPSTIAARTNVGRWHFVLEQLDGTERLEAADSEYSVNRERLALLSVVRGLEALEQPSQVTLVTTSRYVSRGLRYGLSTWRESDYKWERFGEQKPIRNSDLWRRIDVAMNYHGVKCRLIDAGHPSAAPPTSVPELHPSAAELCQGEAGPVRQPIFNSSQGSCLLPACDDGETYGPISAPSSKGMPPHPRGHLITLRFGGLSTQIELKNSSNWWSGAQAWIRWWRGRRQVRPAFSNA